MAGEMRTQEVSTTLYAVAKLAEERVDPDAAAVETVSEQARRVAGEMGPEEVSNTLYAIAGLAEKGVEVDAAVVRAVSERYGGG